MTMHTPMPVSGYNAQPTSNIDLVNANKTLEEQTLRVLDGLDGKVDPRWLAMGRTHIEQGWMAVNRAIFQPSRVSLPGDPT